MSSGHFSSLIAAMQSDAPRTPVSVLTGFLGSGKTTLLNTLLRLHDLSGTVVIVNEFGEIGIDQDLISEATENTLLLANGCLCCATRGDLIDAMHSLRERLGADLRRIIIETSGLADPSPILRTLTAEPSIIAVFQLAAVACTIDALHGVRTLAEFPEARAQLGVADHVFVTRLDQTDGGVSDELDHLLRDGHTQAVIHQERSEYARILDEITREATASFETLADPGPYYRPVAAASASAMAAAPVGSTDSPASAASPEQATSAAPPFTVHAGGVSASLIQRTKPIPWGALQAWLDTLAATRGNDLLRIKGMVCVAEHPDRPVVIHGVQHVFSVPEILPAWPGPDTGTRIVLITRNLSTETLELTLDVLTRRHARST